MFDDTRLHEALELLGALLDEREQRFELLAIGGGALLLSGLTHRATADLDVVARRGGRRWTRSRPLPPELVQAIDDVAIALSLESSTWLNDGPSFLFEMGLPTGWEDRATRRAFGALTLYLIGRQDLVTLKLWAATDARAPERTARDLDDLRQLRPTPAELAAALRRCADKDGTPDFPTHAPVSAALGALGYTLAEVLDAR